MKKILFTVAISAAMFAPVKHTLAWGDNGHRITAKIGEIYLTPKAKAAVEKILGKESMAIASTWCSDFGDESSSSSCYYSSLPEGGKEYIVKNIENIVKELKSPTIDAKSAKANLRALIYLIGDIHQPLNVSYTGDALDSEVKVKWFGKETNLHKIWDSELIDHQKLSYTEYVEFINRPTKAQGKKYLASTNVTEWANESVKLHSLAYEIGDKDLSYQYSHDNIKQLEKRLLQGGMHLAALLNSIYNK